MSFRCSSCGSFRRAPYPTMSSWNMCRRRPTPKVKNIFEPRSKRDERSRNSVRRKGKEKEESQ
jgi:hypothetical protein